jgi:transcriptional regulator with XRE-family HTH domain
VSTAVAHPAQAMFEPIGLGMDRRLMGLRLRELREAIGVSQPMLAKLLTEALADDKPRTTVSQSSVSQWERGDLDVPGPLIPELCAILKCRPDDLFRPPSVKLPKRGRGRPPKPKPPRRPENN